MLQVPTYALYGEVAAQGDAEFLHCETIEARSRRHDFRIRPHRHEQFFQLLLLTGGAGEVAFDGIRAVLTPPCLVLLPSLVVHDFLFSNDVGGLVLTLYERHLATLLRGDHQAAALLAGPLVVPLARDRTAARTIAGSLAAVAAEFAGRAPGRLGMIEAHLAVALLAACRAHLAAPSLSPGTQVPGVAHVARFRQLVDSHFRTHLAVEDYASKLGVTPVHLRRLCRRHLGATPLGAINARLLLEARRLLVFTSLGVKEVAAALGFADHAYFSRFFRRGTGRSPTAFRATLQTTPLAAASVPRRPAGARPATGRSAA